MKKFIPILFILSLFSEPPLNYISIGLDADRAAGHLVSLFSHPTVTIGRRLFHNSHAGDYSLGAMIDSRYQQLIGQYSYLYYPWRGLYLGVGAEFRLTHLVPSLAQRYQNQRFVTGYDIPITLGFQQSSSAERSFVQLQVQPLPSIRYRAFTALVSYGFSF